MSEKGGSVRQYSEVELKEFFDKIEQVISNQELKVVFQPLVCLKDHSIFAYEALARNPSGVFSNPPEMFEAAVAVGRCGELGRLLREIATAGPPRKRAARIRAMMVRMMIPPNRLREVYPVSFQSRDLPHIQYITYEI